MIPCKIILPHVAKGGGEGGEITKQNNYVFVNFCAYKFSSSGLFGLLLLRKVQNGIRPLSLDEKKSFVLNHFRNVSVVTFLFLAT